MFSRCTVFYGDTVLDATIYSPLKPFIQTMPSIILFGHPELSTLLFSKEANSVRYNFIVSFCRRPIVFRLPQVYKFQITKST